MADARIIADGERESIAPTRARTEAHDKLNDALAFFEKGVREAFALAQIGVAWDSRPLGVIVRETRGSLNLSLAEAASRAGITKSHLWEIEQGRASNPTCKTVHGISVALGIPLNVLFCAALDVAPRPSHGEPSK